MPKKNPPELNVLNKYARYKITVVFLGRKQAQGWIGLWGCGGQSGSLQNWFGGGGGGTTCTYMYKQHSIENTGSVKMPMRTLTPDSQSVFRVEWAFCPPYSPIFYRKRISVEKCAQNAGSNVLEDNVW